MLRRWPFSLRRHFETLVRTAPLAEVTSRSPEDDPRSVGLEPTVVADIWSAAEKTYLAGLYPAIALCVGRRGKVVLDRAIGHARGNAPHDPLGHADDTIQFVFGIEDGHRDVGAFVQPARLVAF